MAEHNGHDQATWPVAIVGLGRVGLATAIGLYGRCERIIGVDISEERLEVIAARCAGLAGDDGELLDAALGDGTLELTSDTRAVTDADAVVICVPAHVDHSRVPDLAALHGACAGVVAAARPEQTIILSSTTYIGATRELLTEPLAARGLRAGTDVFVAFSAERIDSGGPGQRRWETPMVVGGATKACTKRAAHVLSHLSDIVYLLSSPDAAEAAKLYENIFGAVSLALANEFADACAALGLDPVEVTLAADAGPHGFRRALPGPGMGGRCNPCAAYYLLWQLGKHDRRSPLIEEAMHSIALRPGRVVDRAGEMLAAGGGDLAGAKVLVVGASHRPGAADVAESPAIPIIAGLVARGSAVSYYDPLVPVLRLPSGQEVRTLRAPRGEDFDIAIVHTLHPGAGYAWVADCPRVLDASYEFGASPNRAVV